MRRIVELRRIYMGLMQALLKATQYGVREREKAIIEVVSPVGLRHGVASAQHEAGAIARLLIRKGLITEVDYWEALTESVGDDVLQLEKYFKRSFRSGLVLP